MILDQIQNPAGVQRFKPTGHVRWNIYLFRITSNLFSIPSSYSHVRLCLKAPDQNISGEILKLA
jgi:hypothetical protein